MDSAASGSAPIAVPSAAPAVATSTSPTVAPTSEPKVTVSDLPNAPKPVIEKSQLIQTAPNAAVGVVPLGVATKPNAEDLSQKIAPIAAKSAKQDNVFSSANDLVNSLLGRNKVVSLMYNDEELSDIERAIESFKNDQAFVPGQDPKDAAAAKKKNKTEKDAQLEAENEKSYIYLASILYYSPNDWAVWINNTKITSDGNAKPNKELAVKEISRDAVKIVWSISVSKWKILSGKKSEDLAPKINAQNNVEIEFTLKQNQTFILGSGRVVEGRAVVNVAREKEVGKKEVVIKK